jgi:hypothetical protein
VVIDNLLDIGNLILIVNINFNLIMEIQVDTVIGRSNYKDVLIIIGQKELRLHFEWRNKFPNCCYFLRFKIKSENLIDFGKQNAISFKTFFELEVEIH